MARIDRKAFYVRRLRGSIYPYGNQFENPSMRGCAVGGGVLTNLISFFWEIAVGTSEIVGSHYRNGNLTGFLSVKVAAYASHFPEKSPMFPAISRRAYWAVQTYSLTEPLLLHWVYRCINNRSVMHL